MNNQLQKSLLDAFPNASISSHTKRDWSSLYFSGEAHQVCLRFEDEPAGAVAYANILTDKVDVNLDEVVGLYILEYTPLVEDDSVFITLEVVTLNS